MESEKQKHLKELADALLKCHKYLLIEIENDESHAPTIMMIVKTAQGINLATEDKLDITVKLRDN